MHKGMAVIFLFLSLLPPSAHTPDCESAYRQGMSFAENDHIARADSIFQQLLRNDKKCVWGWIGKGVLADIRKPGSRKAVRFLKRALHCDDENAEAYYRLAVVYSHQENQYLRVRENLQRAVWYEPERTDAWEMIGEVNASFWMEEESFRLYSRSIKRHESVEMLSSFVDFGLHYGKDDELIELLQLLKKKAPNNHKIYVAESRVYLNNGLYTPCINFLDLLPDSIYQQNISEFKLVKADALLNLEKNKEGDADFWEAIEAMQDSAQAAAIFHDTEYLFTDAEKQFFETAPIDSIRVFFKRFWNQRDPNPVTPENERLAQHYQRLGYARRHHRRFSSVSKSFQLIGDRDPNMLVGEEIDVAPNQPVIDDIGVTIIRHGFPDEQHMNPDAKKDGNFQQASYLYYANAERPKMVFHFILFPSSGWTFTTLPLSFQGLDFLGSEYQRLSMYAERYEIEQRIYENDVATQVLLQELQDEHESENGTSPLEDRAVWDNTLYSWSGAVLHEENLNFEIRQAAPILTRENLEHIKVGMETESASIDYTLFDMPLVCLAFKGKNGGTDVEVFNAIPGSQTELAWSSGRYFLALSTFVGLYTEQWDLLTSFTKADTFQINVHEDWAGRSLLQQKTLSFDPGEYNLVFQTLDQKSKSTAIHRFAYTVPQFSSDALHVSDILLCSDIDPARRDSRFRRGDIAFTPHMFHAFKKTESLGLYFEVYGLSLDNGASDYTVSVNLQEQGRGATQSLNLFDRWFGRGASVGSTVRYQAAASDEPITLSLGIENLTAGDYELKLIIQESATGRTAEKTCGFSIE